MTLKLPGRLVLVGAGKMGGALLEGWLADGAEPSLIDILDPGAPPSLEKLAAEKHLCLNPELSAIADAGETAIVVIAVKPQMMGDVLPGLKPLATAKPLFISVAAGTTIATFESHFGADAAIVRTIPNTPASVGRGMTVGFANRYVGAARKKLAQGLLEAVGLAAWVESEDQIDDVTAVSGSGPAYVFHLVECMAEAGIAAGLSQDLAMMLARQTVTGAGELLHRSELDAGTLRENVTSPNGTTAAALAVLRDSGKMRDLMVEAVKAAAKRSRELAQ